MAEDPKEYRDLEVRTRVALKKRGSLIWALTVETSRKEENGFRHEAAQCHYWYLLHAVA